MTNQNNYIALRLQQQSIEIQTLLLSQLAAARNSNAAFTQANVKKQFYKLSLPAPQRIDSIFGKLRNRNLLARQEQRGEYKVTPLGTATIQRLFSETELAHIDNGPNKINDPLFGGTAQTLIPPTLAPPALIKRVETFLVDHPFENNVMALTRFPDTKISGKDPISEALFTVKEICSEFGLELHLASDEALVDDLWGNVAAHMWSCRYGIAIFEDSINKGLNHNLLIEVGAMIMTGRRCALLKDATITNMPTDFVGMLYKPIELSNQGTVRLAVKNWIQEDLFLSKDNS